MQYALSQPSVCWMCAASSVWTVNVTRDTTRKTEARIYFLRAAAEAEVASVDDEEGWKWREFVLVIGTRWWSTGEEDAVAEVVVRGWR